jgi:GT2 family glycosyltransferase
VRGISLPWNPGYGGGNNVGLRLAQRDEYVLLVNPDCLAVGGDVLNRLAEAMGAAGADIAVPRIRPSRGSGGFVVPFLPTPRNYLLWALAPQFILRHLPRRSEPPSKSWRYVSNFSGAAVVLSPRAQRVLVGFDEDFFLYMEDTDLSFRARGGQIRAIEVDDALVTHVGGQSTRAFARHRIADQALVARGIYFQKHHGERGVNAFLAQQSVISPLLAVLGMARRRSVSYGRERYLRQRDLMRAMRQASPVDVQDSHIRPHFASQRSSQIDLAKLLDNTAGSEAEE